MASLILEGISNPKYLVFTIWNINDLISLYILIFFSVIDINVRICFFNKPKMHSMMSYIFGSFGFILKNKFPNIFMLSNLFYKNKN